MADLAKEAIRNSFMKLLAEKPFEKITVKEVIDDCQIARRTFYYHYQDLYAVLEEILRRETEQVLTDCPTVDNWEEAFITASRFVLENRRAVYHLYNSERRLEIMRYVDRISEEIMDRFLTAAAGGRPIPEEDRRLIAEFYCGALSSIVFRWLDDGMRSDPVQAVRRIGRLFEGSIERALTVSLAASETGAALPAGRN